MRKWLLLVCACVPFTAMAQPAPDALPPVIPVWGEIETIQANAMPGPALWRVSKGDAEVWVLGLAGGLPKGITWNSASLSDVMKGSRAILLPPRPEMSAGVILSAGWLLISECCSFFRLDKGKLDDLLPEATKIKLSALRQSVGGDAKLYQGDEPLGAAQRLAGDTARKHDLNGESPMSTVLKLASSHDVDEQPASRFNPLPIVREALKLTPQQQLPCLDAALEDTERRIMHARPMAEAWAVGDIEGMKAHFTESRTMDCMAAAVKTLGALQQAQVTDMVGAIARALEKPGKTFAVVQIGPLLRKGGVLEQLQARGLTIEAPQ